MTGESIEQVQEWAAQDPYAKAGLFRQVAVDRWKRVFQQSSLVQRP